MNRPPFFGRTSPCAALGLGLLCLTLGAGCGSDPSSAADMSGGGDLAGRPDLMPPPVQTDPPRRTPQIEDCKTTLPPPPAGQRCAVTPGSKAGVVVRAGSVLLPDRVARGGAVIIDGGGRITCAGCNCASDPMAADLPQVTCAADVLSPALINTHDHLTYDKAAPAAHGQTRYDHRHQWRIGDANHPKIDVPGSNNASAVQWSELRHVLGGATASLGAGSGKGVLRNLDAAQTAGAAENLPAGLNLRVANSDTFPLGDSSGKMLTSGCAYPSLPTSEELQPLDAYVPHVAEGVNDAARNELLCLSTPAGIDVASPRTAMVHAVPTDPQSARHLGQTGTAVVWSPRSNVDLYGNTASAPMLDRSDVLLTLGTDWTASGSMNLLRELRCADELNQKYFARYFSDEDLWRMVTLNAALASGAAAALGQLSVGRAGDVTLFRGAADRVDHRAVVAADVPDVLLVLRGGVPLYGEAAVLEALGQGDAQGCEALDVCQNSRRVCAQRETGKRLADLEIAAGKPIYTLFSCGTPPGEPSCVPFRPGEYTGVASADDPDGDGVRGAADNCPTVFNPPRPLDAGKQPDTDGDGTGDACDACPLEAAGLTCAVHQNTLDRDRDGIPDAMDNCPGFANPTQDDTDKDGFGDACDNCPAFANPNFEACATTVAGMRDPKSPGRPRLGAKITLAQVVVTAVRTVRSAGFYVRDVSGGPDYAGILVFTGGTNKAPTAADGTPIAEGQILSLSGVFDSFHNIAEITSPTQIKINGTMAVEPVAVSVADLLNAATRPRLEGQLVRLSNVTMRRKVTPPQNGMDDDFYVSDSASETCMADKPACARVGDFILDGDTADGKPPFTADAALQSVTGIVDGTSDFYAIEVRRQADIVGP